jgi:hypothetical protein
MKKFRIIELVHNVSDLGKENSRSKIEYIIQKKHWLFGWVEIFNREETNVSRVSHESYKEAESYMIENYMRDGMFKKIGCEYHYEAYSYGF